MLGYLIFIVEAMIPKAKMRNATLTKDYNISGFLMIETLLQAILEQVDQPKRFRT